MARKTRTPSPADDEELYEVEKIKDHKVETENGRVKVLFKIRWKGYKPDDDTWEPREILLEGAQNILDGYIEKLAKKGETIPEDGSRRKSKARPSETAPVSVDSSSNKRKKKESMAAEPEDEQERPKKKKEKITEPIDLSSPDPEPVPAKKEKKEKKVSAPVSQEPTPKKKRERNEEEEAPPSEKASRRQSAREPFESVIIEVPPVAAQKGSDAHRHESSWEGLVIVETMESEEDRPGHYKWFIRWSPEDDGEWVSNEVARRKFPQRLIDFYEGHLKFKVPAEDAEAEEEEQA